MHILFQLNYGSVFWSRSLSLYIAGVHHIRISHGTSKYFNFSKYRITYSNWKAMEYKYQQLISLFVSISDIGSSCYVMWKYVVQYQMKMLFLLLYAQKHCLICRRYFSDKLGSYSETGFHIGMDRNFVCLWRRHNCRSQVTDLFLSALISCFMKSITGFLYNSNLQAIISTFKKNYL